MKLLEYKAQDLFAQYDIPTMNGVVIEDTKDVGKVIQSAGISYPVVIKAQVQVGGRGKAGGVQFANDAEQAQTITEKLLFSELKGLKVNKLFVVEKANPQKEWYLSIMLDRLSKCPLIIFSEMGGVDIEEVAKTDPEKILKIPVNPALGISDYIVRYIVTRGGIGAEWTKQMKNLLDKLYALFMDYSCMLAEINPLVVDESGVIIALDGKVDIDDSALYCLPDIEEFAKTLPVEPLVKEAADFHFLFIPIEEDGNIAVMSNGSGMLMSCIDLISKRGMKVGAALDLGGGATAERIKEAVRIVLSDPKTEVLFISIFGGITRCDEVAGGVKAAFEAREDVKTVIIRIEGTNKQEGLNIISSIEGNKVISVNSIPEGVQALAERRGLA
jgi:succinyl-CoA synthetase beta subunit